MNNSFKELEKLHLEQFEKKSPEIKQQIDGETSSYKFIGDILDLYFNKIMGVFVAMTGGDIVNESNNINPQDKSSNKDTSTQNPTD